MTNSIIVTDEALARRVLMSSSWGVVGKEGAQATQQVMVLPGAGLDALDSVERDSGIGSPDTRRFDHGPCEELKSSIDGIVDAAVGDTVHFGQVDIQAICRSAAASVAAAVVDIDAELLQAIIPDLAPCLDAVVSPQRLDTAWALLRRVSNLRWLLREGGVDPNQEPLVISELLVWSAVADVAALHVLSSALENRQGSLVQGTRVEAAEAASKILRRQPPMILHTRVALEKTVLGDFEVDPGDQAVLLDVGDQGDGGLMAAAGGPWAAVEARLPWFTSAIARRVTAVAGNQVRLQGVRARRSPVTRRWARATLEDVEATT